MSAQFEIKIKSISETGFVFSDSMPLDEAKAWIPKIVKLFGISRSMIEIVPSIKNDGDI